MVQSKRNEIKKKKKKKRDDGREEKEEIRRRRNFLRRVTTQLDTLLAGWLLMMKEAKLSALPLPIQFRLIG
jgi:hypothetical protein